MFKFPENRINFYFFDDVIANFFINFSSRGLIVISFEKLKRFRFFASILILNVKNVSDWIYFDNTLGSIYKLIFIICRKIKFL